MNAPYSPPMVYMMRDMASNLVSAPNRCIYLFDNTKKYDFIKTQNLYNVYRPVPIMLKRVSSAPSASPQSSIFETSTLEQAIACKSDEKLNHGVPPAHWRCDHEFLRCCSEGAVPLFKREGPGSELLSGWVGRRASFAPNRRVSISTVPRNCDGTTRSDLSTNTVEDVKRRWRAQQIAMQQNLAMEQNGWRSGWLQRSRCALNILYRHK